MTYVLPSSTLPLYSTTKSGSKAGVVGGRVGFKTTSFGWIFILPSSAGRKSGIYRYTIAHLTAINLTRKTQVLPNDRKLPLPLHRCQHLILVLIGMRTLGHDNWLGGIG